ncbi:ribonuclease T2-like [Polyodon spathula]|uniref:ribonuclease T2-like n=1 Tax=Polyodon spathula TaxID=7913 RepID=UPI001B7DB649|nr:ribonuclease T2-like [Polyodon spathula]
MDLTAALSLALICSLVLISTQEEGIFQEDHPEKFCAWECMTFTLMWPGAYCVGWTKIQCKIPDYVKNWTIHGLWPMVKERTCCECWPIFHSDLVELEPQLSLLWPTLINKKSNYSFWKQEWHKHGACAGCVEGMNGPTKYFQTALKLRSLYSIDGALYAAGIHPSCNTSYQYGKLHSALAPGLGDLHVMQCVQDRKNRQVLVQVKIPMYKNFTLGCQRHHPNLRQDSRKQATSPGHPCRYEEPIYYFPISRESPEHPCD